MLEHWFGPYRGTSTATSSSRRPPGLEHQSAIAYGNHFLNGYLGATCPGRASSAVGLHHRARKRPEWWGNNSRHRITPTCAAQSFANYARGALYRVPAREERRRAYMIGARRGVRNDRPVVPVFGVNAQGSGDMLSKGGNMLHTIRAILDDDAQWRDILSRPEQDVYHSDRHRQTSPGLYQPRGGTRSQQGIRQYLTTTKIPVFEFGAGKYALYHGQRRPGFDMAGRGTGPGFGDPAAPSHRAWQSLEASAERRVERRRELLCHGLPPP